MKKQEKIQFILDNVEYLNDKDWTVIHRLYRNVDANKKVNLEENEFLEKLMHTNSLHIRKKIELVGLQELISTFFHEKGLKNSMFNLDELLSVISNDIRTIDNHMIDNMESINEMKKLITVVEKKKGVCGIKMERNELSPDLIENTYALTFNQESEADHLCFINFPTVDAVHDFIKEKGLLNLYNEWLDYIVSDTIAEEEEGYSIYLIKEVHEKYYDVDIVEIKK